MAKDKSKKITKATEAALMYPAARYHDLKPDLCSANFRTDAEMRPTVGIEPVGNGTGHATYQLGASTRNGCTKSSRDVCVKSAWPRNCV